MTSNNNLGSIGFFSTYRPPLPLDLYSLPISQPLPLGHQLRVSPFEKHLTDGKSYNYNGQYIPPNALKAMLRSHPQLAAVGTAADVEAGLLTGIVFVSERKQGLETLQISLRLGDSRPITFSFAEIYGTYGPNDVHMQDSGVIAGDEYLIYVTTQDPAPARRQPWTSVYKIHLVTGETERLTPTGQADLSPSVSPDGNWVAVASFEGKQDDQGWQGEIEDLATNIYVMKIDDPTSTRTMVIENGGWPTWGSDSILFFHRKLEETGDYWGVFRADISNGFTSDAIKITDDKIRAFTPTAIDANTVVVATVRETSSFKNPRIHPDQYRHIEIFDLSGQSTPITKINKPMADHFNPFVIADNNGDINIGYHRGKIVLKTEDPAQVTSQELSPLESPIPHLGLFRVSGVFPTFSPCGTKLAFVDNEFLAVWVTTLEGPLRVVYKADKPDSCFSPVWSKDPTKDIVYFCRGPSFTPNERVEICAIFDASTEHPSDPIPIVSDLCNNAFPATSPDGTRLVYRSTKAVDNDKPDPNFYKNLHIRDEVHLPNDVQQVTTTRITTGPYFDTHCDWSPNGKFIVFSSTRDKPSHAPLKDNDLDAGYFAVYLLAVDNPDVIVRVMRSAPNFAGHVNHPFFNPEGNGIVIASDLAAVSCDPVSLPLFNHSVRPYGDIFTIKIDPENIENNKDVDEFKRMTHSKYENSTCTWANYDTVPGGAFWNLILNRPHTPRCPYLHPDGSEGFQMTGHLIIPNNLC